MSKSLTALPVLNLASLQAADKPASLPIAILPEHLGVPLQNVCEPEG